MEDNYFFKLFSPFWAKGRTTKIYFRQQHLCSSTFFHTSQRAFSFPTPSGFAKGTEGHRARSLAIHPTGAAATSLHPDETYEVAGGWMVSSPGFHGGFKLHKVYGVLLYLLCSLCLKKCKNIHFKKPKKVIFRKLSGFRDMHRKPLIRLECLNISGLNSTSIYIYTYTNTP